MRSALLWIGLLWMLSNVHCSPLIINASFKQSEIRPLRCKLNAKEGVCMFIQECAKLNGTHLGICVDGYLFGSCCSTAKNVATPTTAVPVLTTTSTTLSPTTSKPVPNRNASVPLTSPSTSFKVPDATDLDSTATSANITFACGRAKYNPTGRIVGGTIAKYGRWPWQISVGSLKSGKYSHKCGAVLLNNNWAITAAHCTRMFHREQIILRIGEYDFQSVDEVHPFVERKAKIIASHPRFDQLTKENDLSLIRFDYPVTFQANMIPVCLPERGVSFLGQMAYVTGWGRLYEYGPISAKLRQVSVPVISNSECEEMFKQAGTLEAIPNVFICAGFPSGNHDACEGDSGGPMVLQRGDHWVLGGITSWGIGCGEANRPGVYTRITEYLDWINKIIAI